MSWQVLHQLRSLFTFVVLSKSNSVQSNADSPTCAFCGLSAMNLVFARGQHPLGCIKLDHKRGKASVTGLQVHIKTQTRACLSAMSCCQKRVLAAMALACASETSHNTL